MDVTEYAVLGRHRVAVPRSDEECFDAVDLLLRDLHGDVRVIGLRTRDYVLADRERPCTDWDGYPPLPIALDLRSVPYWDFNTVLWVGPARHRCLVWSNAEAFSERAFATLFGRHEGNRLLAGPEGRGLPTPSELGLTVPADVRWVPLGTPSR